MKHSPCCVWLGLAVVLSGCEGVKPRNLPMGKVSGAVTVDDQPLKTGTVTFQHSSGEMASAGLGADGKYSLSGAVGKNLVIVTSREPERENPDANAMPRILPGKNNIPDRYSDFQASGLTFDVKSGDNTYDIKLKSK